MELINKNKKLFSIILLALIIYFRCDFGIVEKYAVVMNLGVYVIGFVFCLILTRLDFDKTKKSILNIGILWLALFQAMQFMYGHFDLFEGNNIYSMQYTILTVLPALLCFEILWHNKEDIIEIMSKVGCIVIVATYITTIKYDYLWGLALQGQFYRLGKVPGGTDIDTGNLYLLMLIPILYSIIVLKKIKPYIVFAIFGAIGIVLTGSKSSALPLVLVIGIMLLGTAKNSKDVKKYVAGFIAFVVLGTVALFTIPILYDTLGYRIVEVYSALVNPSDELWYTSTGQRLAVFKAFKEHFGERPILGHGFYSFMTMPYSKIESYRTETGFAFRNIQTHMNYMELLFSFGFFGFVMYYWFPIKLIIDTVKSKSKEAKIICLSFLVSILFMDMGLDMFYKYMTPYYVYLLIFTFIEKGKENN